MDHLNVGITAIIWQHDETHYTYCLKFGAGIEISSHNNLALILYMSVRRLMLASGVRKARAQRESGAQADLLEEYAVACTRVDFQPPLSVAESTFLQDLQSER